MAGSENALIELWPEGAPYAAGTTDEDRPALTPYPAAGSKGAVIVCPGGGYGMRADHEGEPIALWLNSIGISAFVLRYRVAPYKHPSPLLDAQRAIRYVRLHAAEYGIDPEKIGILGFSAGGHLASSAATLYDSGRLEADDPIDRMSSRPNAAILCYPVISMGPAGHSGSLANLLGDEPDAALVARMSTELQVTADTPPTFLWHTSDDAAVPVENALLFAAALSRAGVPFDLHVYEKGPHGMGLAERDPHVGNWTTVCGLWLKRYDF
ncbi:alpha/beta hydrolase [Paenibacillus sacheonensis]|uniref:Alpha/beta hydrolase fold domain-containing protein n=1 Tax=Paenibacillus sacheonensis TaxID=742054 RepID=A0A7X4YKV6_9BACL|nr:alpha/beta hydrolase [Paenibacillus sacheonensis]MBM7564134.1 acetyl esterase/lipase [Paenibacillus sacheonensis]NBC67536.1 alpha/beta hydrolase fold domain-containing protein [Paenibacillus sacheonensis]